MAKYYGMKAIEHVLSAIGLVLLGAALFLGFFGACAIGVSDRLKERAERGFY